MSSRRMVRSQMEPDITTNHNVFYAIGNIRMKCTVRDTARTPNIGKINRRD
jgi:hypothetical protein